MSHNTISDLPISELDVFVSKLFNLLEQTETYTPNCNNNSYRIYSQKQKTAIFLFIPEIDEDLKQSKTKIKKWLTDETLISKNIQRIVIVSTSPNDAILFEYIQLLNSAMNLDFSIEFCTYAKLENFYKLYFSIVNEKQIEINNSYQNQSDKTKIQFGLDASIESIKKDLSKTKKIINVFSHVNGSGCTLLLSILGSDNIIKKQFNQIIYIETFSSIEISICNQLLDKINFNFSEFAETTILTNIIDIYFSQLTGLNLLIFDKIITEKQFAQIKRYTKNPNLRFLIGSNRKFQGAKNIPIPSLKISDAIYLFNEYCNNNFNPVLIEALVEKLNFHPFLIKFVATKIQSNTELNPNQIIHWLDEQDKRIPHLKQYISSDLSASDQYRIRQIIKYLLVFYEHEMQNFSKQEKNVLRVFSLLPEISFSFKELCKFLNINKSEEDIFSNILIELASKNWICINNNNFFIPDLIRIVLHKKLKPNHKNLKNFINHLIDLTINFNHADLINLKILTVIESVIANLDQNHENIASLTNNIALIYKELNQIESAWFYNHKTLEIQKQLFTDNPSNIKLAENIATLLCQNDRFKEALNYALKVLNIKTKKLDENHPEIARTLKFIAIIYQNINDLDNAIKYIDLSLDIYKEHFSPDNPELIAALQLQEHICALYL